MTRGVTQLEVLDILVSMDHCSIARLRPGPGMTCKSGYMHEISSLQG
jgi:hypothetical protein